MLASPFTLWGVGSSSKHDDSSEGHRSRVKPKVSLHTDKDVYRPGDSILVTIEISNLPCGDLVDGMTPSLLVERLGFELKGMEKLDIQWFSTQTLLSGSKGRRGEYVFLDCSAPAIVSSRLISPNVMKTYMVRAMLPDVIPPSYRGSTIRYLYYIRCTLSGRWLTLENSRLFGETSKEYTELETRRPLQIWVNQEGNGLLMDESRYDEIVPSSPIQTDLFWKEKDEGSEWARANDPCGGEEGYESSRDEISSVSSYHNRENLHKAFGSSLSLQSAARSSFKDASYLEGEGASLRLEQPQLSVAEVIYDSGDAVSTNMSLAVSSSSPEPERNVDASVSPSARVIPEPLTSESRIRGRSYNIRLDDQVLLRFSPKNSDSIYFFSDAIGGTLTFFHEEGTRRCLEVSITLETSETINQRFVHPSRRNAPKITKVVSDHHEVVADLVQTSFLFSIPMDGPMSFATPHVSVQWILRFEFLVTPKNVDWRRYEHPLLVEGRDKSEWILPITVHAPTAGNSAQNRSEKPFMLGPSWISN